MVDFLDFCLVQGHLFDDFERGYFLVVEETLDEALFLVGDLDDLLGYEFHGLLVDGDLGDAHLMDDRYLLFQSDWLLNNAINNLRRLRIHRPPLGQIPKMPAQIPLNHLLDLQYLRQCPKHPQHIINLHKPRNLRIDHPQQPLINLQSQSTFSLDPEEFLQQCLNHDLEVEDGFEVGVVVVLVDVLDFYELGLVLYDLGDAGELVQGVGVLEDLEGEELEELGGDLGF